MSPEQKAALCEYVDGQREAGLRFDEIAEKLEVSLPEADLENLELWHRQWKKAQWREEVKRQHTDVPVGDMDFAAGGAVETDWSSETGHGAKEVIATLAQNLIRSETRGCGKPRWRIEKGLSEWTASGAGNATLPFRTLYLRYEAPETRNWLPLCTRSLREGQTCEYVKGPGQAGGVRWFRSAVIFRTDGQVDHVEAEARVRRRVYPGTPRAIRLGLNREAVQLEKLNLVREQLDQEEICARVAALLHTYLGKTSGIKSGAHLARLTGRTRQAVSARKLLIAEKYYETTGGRSGFEGLSSADRHRKKVRSKTSSPSALHE